jgi:hypothetical protein
MWRSSTGPFRASYRDARAYEDVRLTPLELSLAKVSARGARDEWRFTPAFVRLEREEHPELGVQRLSLVSRGRRVDVAAFSWPRREGGIRRRLLPRPRRGAARPAVFMSAAGAPYKHVLCVKILFTRERACCLTYRTMCPTNETGVDEPIPRRRRDDRSSVAMDGLAARDRGLAPAQVRGPHVQTHQPPRRRNAPRLRRFGAAPRQCGGAEGDPHRLGDLQPPLHRAEGERPDREGVLERTASRSAGCSRSAPTRRWSSSTPARSISARPPAPPRWSPASTAIRSNPSASIRAPNGPRW